ncbi:MAG TPA: SpoIIE family protein phosphatase [Tepidisphaeraceae bacterium]|jgi:serine phosphatase RsbU (regulator of sigma subunit)|nr:SpoIIE family protein phosphatase [Tepidisphaeraceae bacterium]
MIHKARKLLAGGTAYGIALTLAMATAARLGMLDNLERWFYDRRAAICQLFTPPPTDRLVHLDIDDAAMDAIGAWPWHRSALAQMVDELHLAGPKVVAMDVLFADPQETRAVPRGDGKYDEIHDDQLFAKSLKNLGCALIPVSLPPLPPKALTPAQRALREALNEDPELSEVKEAAALLKRRGFPEQDIRRAVADDFLEFRRQAMYDRVIAQLQRGPMTVAQLRAILLPKTDRNIRSPAVRTLEEQYERATAELSLQPFTRPVPENLPPLLHSEVALLPVTPIARANRTTGFVDFLNETDGTVRRVPLFIEHQGRMYPQISVALAARMLDAEVGDFQITESGVTIPRKGAAPLKLPVYTIRSQNYKSAVPMMFDIPWFGAVNDWESMYSKVGGSHLSINAVWDACRTRQQIAQDSENADQAVEYILFNDETKPGLGIDNARGKRYFASRPDVNDLLARRDIATFALKALAESGFIDAFTGIKNPSLEEASRHEKLLASKRALEIVLDAAEPLTQQLAAQRALLRERMHDKAVLVGWTTTAQVADIVRTSLHAEIPGVIAHGVIFNAILTNHFWHRVPAWVDILMTVLLGLGATFLASRLSPAQALLSAILLGGLYATINGFLVFDWGGHIMGLAGPLVAIAVVWAGCTVMRLLAESRERVRISLETAGLKHEMGLAKKAQEALIPKNPPGVPRLDAVGWTMPASTTGGDCFDLWKTPDGRLGILLADASGHGLGPAMIVTQVRTLVRALSEVESQPHRLLERVNARLANDLDSGQFVTTFLAFLSADGEFQWTSAGHGPVYVRSCADGEMRELEPPSPPLGILPEWFDEPPAPIQMEAGGMLLLVSDGIFEAVTPARDMFGVERMLEIIRAKGKDGSSELVGTLRTAVAKWYDTQEPLDDQTIVIVQREG